jgi:hypothetical protein
MKARHLSTSHESVDTAADALHRAWKLLNKAVDCIRHEAVRERWADLINRLNTEEDAGRIKRPLKKLPPASRFEHHRAPHRATRDS